PLFYHFACNDTCTPQIYTLSLHDALPIYHLDYHKTFDEYLKTKKSFFDHLPASAIAITNGDDKNGKIMLQNTSATKKTFAMKTIDRKSTRLNSSHVKISYAVFCLKKKKIT